MLDGIRQKLKDRRGKYSLLGHVSRLRREGRLPQIGLAAVAVLTVGGIAFSRCQASGITGPSEGGARMSAPSTNTVASGGSVGSSSLGAETFREHTKDREFVFTGVNPCNGEPVIAKGRRHDRINATVSVSGNFDADHHINDSFKSVTVDAQGVEVTDPDLEYVGGDIHNDRMSIHFPEGASHRELTNERPSRRGGGDHWVLHLDQRTEFRLGDLEPTVTIKGHASCPPTSHCKLADGCPDRTFHPVPVTP